MFQNLKVISPAADKQTRFNRADDWNFASQLSAIPVTRDELAKLAADYVIVFTSDTPSYPVALLGLDGKNHYVGDDGQWAVKQIPSRLNIYPFGSSVIDGKAQLVRAANAPHFQRSEGVPLYDDQGEPTHLLDQVTTLAARVHLGFVAAAQLTGQLVNAGLLVDAHVALALPDGKHRAIDGFKAVDEAALASLDVASRERLEANGAMAMLTSHRESLANLARLLAQPDAAAPEAKKVRKPRATKSGAADEPVAAAAKKAAKPAAAASKAKESDAKPAAAKKGAAVKAKPAPK